MISKISISSEKEDGVTRLKESYYNAPYKLVHFGNKNYQEKLELLIMCSSPGVMEGDVLDMDVHIKTNAETKLFTQSFNKLHPMKVGAQQRFTLKLDENSVFQYIPHPITPFEGAIFDSQNELHLEKSSTLIFSDIFTSGRILSGESFKFTKIHSKTKIYRAKELIYMDNVLMDPKNQPIKKSLFWDEFTCHATLIFVSPVANLFFEELNEILTEENVQEIEFGFTKFTDNGIIVRALAKSGEQLYKWIKVVGDMCWQFKEHIDSTELESKKENETEKEIEKKEDILLLPKEILKPKKSIAVKKIVRVKK